VRTVRGMVYSTAETIKEKSFRGVYERGEGVEKK
jgi:hypothetical protein